jgi:hypothetical protein
MRSPCRIGKRCKTDFRPSPACRADEICNLPLSLYSSRAQVCKLGYDSSPACDSYQLGQMIKFLANKKLLFFVDFSPSSYETVGDFATTDVNHLLSLLSQVPSYQIDRHHMNVSLLVSPIYARPRDATRKLTSRPPSHS